jgi:hypothetical protein
MDFIRKEFMNVSQIATWKSNQIASLTNLINTAITGGSMTDWVGHTSDAITPVTTFINSLTYTKKLTAAVIKQQILTVYTYISIKYMSVMNDPALETRFAIPPLILGTVAITGTDDFRNLLVDHELPELDLSYFSFTAPVTGLGAYTVSANENFNTLKTNLSGAWPDAEVSFWTGLADKVQTQTKILYMMFNKPVMKPYDPDNPTDPKSILLDTMHFREAISATPFKADFIDIFPELA